MFKNCVGVSKDTVLENVFLSSEKKENKAMLFSDLTFERDAYFKFHSKRGSPFTTLTWTDTLHMADKHTKMGTKAATAESCFGAVLRQG